MIEVRDILGDLADNKITDAELEALYDGIMDSTQAPNVRQILMLSNQEWTAFGYGVPFRTLATWRMEGWPEHCVNCGKPIVVNGYGWLAREGPKGFVLEHVDCAQDQTKAWKTDGQLT